MDVRLQQLEYSPERAPKDEKGRKRKREKKEKEEKRKWDEEKGKEIGWYEETEDRGGRWT